MPLLSRLVLLLASVAGWDELSDNSTCVRGGITDAMLESHRASVALQNNYGATTNASVFLPVFSSLPLDEESAAHAAVQSAVVFIHGLSGDANSYFCDGLSAVAAAGESERVLVVAPWFGDEQVTVGEWMGSSASSNVSAYWTTSRWLTGGDASPSPARFTTAFDALDDVIELLLGSPTGLFPNLARVVIAGFSAGAQLASRHAFFSTRRDASVAWIISDPSSWLYLDAARPASSCCALRDTGAEHRCGDFAPPTDATAAACPSFDDYKYGLSNLTSAAASNLYLESFAANASHVAAARKRWFTKDVRYQLGDEDVCNCQSAGYQNPLSDVCFPSNVTCTNSEYSWNNTACCDTYPDGTANALSVTCEVRCGRVARARALSTPH